MGYCDAGVVGDIRCRCCLFGVVGDIRRAKFCSWIGYIKWMPVRVVMMIIIHWFVELCTHQRSTQPWENKIINNSLAAMCAVLFCDKKINGGDVKCTKKIKRQSE